MRTLLAPLPVFAFALGTASGQNILARSDDPEIVDFSNFGVGEGVTLLDYGISVTAQKRKHKNGPFIDATAMIFDSENPPEADKDLGTPNRDFGGPGVGPEGRKGQPHENSEPQGNVLIISQDDDPSVPNDHRFGGYILFEFETPMILKEIGLLDNEEDTEFDVERVDNEPQVMLDNEGGDNSFEVVSLGDVVATKLKVTFGGSGAITYLKVAPLTDPPTLSPTIETDSPTSSPTGTAADILLEAPSPTEPPTASPVQPTEQPTKAPTASPVATTETLTSGVTESPTASATDSTDQPTKSPTSSPLAPTDAPTLGPTVFPTASPVPPTDQPTSSPTKAPTASPITPTETPTSAMTESPTASPTESTDQPTESPTSSPTAAPTLGPTDSPTASPVPPTDQPTASPTPLPPAAITFPPTTIDEFIEPPLPIDDEEDCLVLGFSLWNTITSTELSSIDDGSVLCIEDLDSEGVSIKAITDSCVESVTFDLISGPDVSVITDTEADFLVEDHEFTTDDSYLLFAVANGSFGAGVGVQFSVMHCDEV